MIHGVDHNQVVVYHEYTHSILHANTHWLPIWLDEGLAEFYGYTRFEKDRTLIGAPSLRMRYLKTRPPIPVEKMLSVTQRSPEYRDEDLMQGFYAQAWAMVHYMIFGPGMNHGDKLGTFLHKLQEREPQQKAFEEVFGDPKVFQDQLASYTSKFMLEVGVLAPDSRIDPKTFAARELTPAETAYELGCFHLGEHDRARGQALIEQAAQMDPRLAGPHEELAYVAFEEGKDGQAQEQWRKAVELDPTLPRSNYALAMMGKRLSEQSPEELEATRAALQHVVALAPKFAPAYVELALIEWRQGKIQQAFQNSHEAELLEPSRAGYHTLTGRILLRGNQPAVAADYSRYVASHWFGPDHNEAIDLWDDVPAAKRGEQPALLFDVPAGATVLRGQVKAVICPTTPGARLSVTVQPASPASAEPLTLQAGGRFSSGWSDTLWWGTDHFSLCNHVTGYPVVVAYKPDAGRGGDLVDIEIRDELPPGTLPPSAVAASAAVQGSPAKPGDASHP